MYYLSLRATAIATTNLCVFLKKKLIKNGQNMAKKKQSLEEHQMDEKARTRMELRFVSKHEALAFQERYKDLGLLKLASVSH
jgi:hypothetical protein